jgi:hypothetical protein
MKTPTKSKSAHRRRRGSTAAVSVKGDIARAMFARWEKDHLDPKPLSWDQLKAKLEETRLREAPLFSK